MLVQFKNMKKDFIKTIDVYGNADKASIEALQYIMLKNYDVKIECVVKNKHYKLHLYKY
jgi:hypothetical protein